MLQLPTGYLTLDKPPRRLTRVEADEVEAGRYDLASRIDQYVYGKRSDGPQLILFLAVFAAIIALIIRNW